MGADRTEKLDHAERWFRDGLRAIDPPGGLLTIDVDMSAAIALRREMAARGTPVTFTHLVVHATARTLADNPGLHKLVAGNRRLFPGTVDVCLSIAGDAAVTPVLIIPNAAEKTLEQVAGEIRSRADEARTADEKRMALLKKWGWVIPFARVRVALFRALFRRVWYRRMASGTFQVTAVPTVDIAVPFLFNTAAALGAGRIQDRVVALDGSPVVRPTMTLACCCDHKVWNGLDTARFLTEVKRKLEACLESRRIE